MRFLNIPRVNRNKPLILPIVAVTTFFVAWVSAGKAQAMSPPAHDWLITPVSQKASVVEKGNSIILNNGLVRRSFVKASNLACVDYTNLTNGQQLLRAIKPEARITIDHKTYNIGGLLGQKENAYLLPEWITDMKRGKEDFVEVKHTVSDIKPFLQWKCKTWAFN